MKPMGLDEIELDFEELEEVIAPASVNHNETIEVDLDAEAI